MRKQYNNNQNNNITNHFTQLVVEKYIVPAIAMLFLVFFVLLLGLNYFFNTIQELDLIAFIYLISVNVLVTIATLSIYYTIKTCLFGYKQISSKQYTVLQLKCVNKFKKGLHHYCTLSDNYTYKLYNDDADIKIGGNCDLIIISNEYGAKLWEIVVATK
jgi:hypothetical protein